MSWHLKKFLNIKSHNTFLILDFSQQTDDTQSAKSSVASNRNSQDSTQLLNPSEVKETSLVSPSASEHRRTSGDGCDVGECDVTNNKGDVTKAADDVTKEKSFDEMTGEEKAVKQREYVLQVRLCFLQVIEIKVSKNY